MLSADAFKLFSDKQVAYLKKVGPARADILEKEINIRTFGDLLQYYPSKYIDRSHLLKIAQVNQEHTYVSLKGKIFGKELLGNVGKGRRLVAWFQDDTGTADLVWFQGIKYISDTLKEGQEVIMHGRPGWFQNKLQFAHPEIEPIIEGQAEPKGILPFYSTTEKMKKAGLDSRGMRQLLHQVLEVMPALQFDSLSDAICRKYHLMSFQDAVHAIHFPKSMEIAQAARRRMKFEELFFFQFMLASLRLLERPKHLSPPFLHVGSLFHTFYEEHLPFTLTNAQKRVLREVRQDLAKPVQMNRLVQGDVGSGKTMVAFMTMLIALDNGYQAALMAPTEILAQQHYRNIANYANALNIGVGILTGKTKTKDRNILASGLEEGSIQILMGTHALLEDKVRFKKLGLTVIDEQHKFGVLQRAKLWSKAELYPHNMVMTATPIPRTLALTLYGDLDVSVIDELPPGRKPVVTKVVHGGRRNEVYAFLVRELKSGRQVYFVYPLVAESEKSDLKAAEEAYIHLCAAFPASKVGLVHGKMKAPDKDAVMQAFKAGDLNILVSTTVIEVGVDVPNSTVMVIENAERFGLSQLHQLRGRVGRGGNQSYCILMVSDKISKDGKARLHTMEETNDGFKISEVDLQIRGPGDFLGTRQSGLPDFKIANIAEDGAILMEARAAAEEMSITDPTFSAPAHAGMKEKYRLFYEANRKFAGIA